MKRDIHGRRRPDRRFAFVAGAGDGILADLIDTWMDEMSFEDLFYCGSRNGTAASLDDFAGAGPVICAQGRDGSAEDHYGDLRAAQASAQMIADMEHRTGVNKLRRLTGR
jgi:hypothetical protein